MKTAILIILSIGFILWVVGCTYIYIKHIDRLERQRDNVDLKTIRGQAQKKVLNRKIEKLKSYNPWNRQLLRNK